MELNRLLEAIGKELKNTTTAAEIGYLPSEGIVRKDNKLSYTSHSGRIKVKQLDNNQWEIEIDGQVEKGDYVTILKKAIEAKK